MPERRRILIVCFDALRPDMATPDLMPNLNRFADSGVRFTNSHSTFPTETRVNQATLVTGVQPGRHGIVGNKFLDRVASPDALFNTGDTDALRAGDNRLGGRLVDVPVLGEVLAGQNLSLAVVSSGTPGGTLMLHHKAETAGGFRLSLHRPDASAPADKVAAAVDRAGPIPKHEIPSLSWLTYTVDVFLDFIEPVLRPDVTILWFCEPDNSYHYKGIGCDANIAAIRHADTEFGRLLAWRTAAGLDDDLDVITLSDHGQITVDGPALKLKNLLEQAGFTVGETTFGGADVALALSSAGGLYIRDGDEGLIERVASWLCDQPWCGPIITRDGRYGLSHAQINWDHPRAPDIGLVLRTTDEENGFGYTGTTLQDAAYPDGGGLHGGLHRKELHNWLAVQGPSFKVATITNRPAGIVDIAPTVYRLLQLEPDITFDGRVLTEALRGDTTISTDAVEETIKSPSQGHVTGLSVSTVGNTRYLNRAWAEPNSPS